MKIQFLYLISLLLYISKGFSQDIIVKTDSSKIEAKILEVRTSEIQYKLFNFQDGPLYVVSKNDIAYVVYANGVKEIFETPKKIDTTPITPYISKDTIFTNPTPPKGSENVHQAKVGDYIKFNLQVGAVINNAYSNLTSVKPPPSHTSGGEFSGNNDEKYYNNINFGFNFLFGNNRYIKHVIGVNYLRSKGEFNYDYYAVSSSSSKDYTQYHESYKFKSTADFINIITGLRFSIGKHINFEPLVAFNYLIKADERITGNITTYNYSVGQYSNGSTEIEYINNEKVNKYDSKIKSTVSLCPRISYEFKIKQHKIGTYASYNLAYHYRLPWYMIGITYYPLKKMSPSIDNKKIKIFNQIKLNVEVGITLSTSLTNIPEGLDNSYSYDSFKAANKKTQTGFNLGLNLISGNNPYCKHILGVSYVQAKGEFKRTSTNSKKELDKLYDYRRDLNVKSTSHFLNIGTGIRFVLFKHINLDNSFVFNIPIISNNKYDGFEYLQEYTYKGASNGGTYYQTNYSSQKINASKSSERLYRYSIAFSPKVSFDLKIREQLFGMFFNFNFALQQNIQWHMIGISYYPFKKLR